jgi:hypothetical protein
LATHAATSVSGESVDAALVLAAILDDELVAPPIIGGDEEVDSLVQSIVAMGALVSKTAHDQGTVDAAIDQVRRAALLAELRHVASEARHSPEAIAAIETRLDELLHDIKGVPLVGVVTEVITNVLGSEDPADRSKLREFALKLKRSGPLIARAVLPAVQNMTRHQEQVRTNGTSPHLMHPANATPHAKAPGTDWKNPVNRPVLEAALRDAGGVKVRAAKLLGIGQPYLQTLVKLHGLSAFSTEIRSSARAQPPSTTSLE